MNNNIFNMLLGMIPLMGEQYDELTNEDDYEFFSNQKVSDCLFKMYFLMLTTDKEEQERLYNEAFALYDSLELDEKKYIKNKIISLFAAQDEHERKVKEKKKNE